LAVRVFVLGSDPPFAKGAKDGQPEMIFGIVS